MTPTGLEQVQHAEAVDDRPAEFADIHSAIDTISMI
jgi:hypothetical protein